ncbi:MAG: response regulator transcription factor [Deltaproteobacteria bacterium]|jgi:DNA-binding NarL/FixJ family response regulator
MSPEKNNLSTLKDKFIFVVGPRRLQNELILYFLEQNAGATCRVGSDSPLSSAIAGTGTNQPPLVLWDFDGGDEEECKAALECFPGDILSRDYVALFNVLPNLGIEEEALSRGVRGFFYVEDTLEQLQKGIMAIFEGELWVSRGIMSKFVLDKKEYQAGSQKNSTLLTRREIEILSLVAAGATNEDVAKTLFISPNTVRTHIYNIFKKINVPNRLQAALWAAKNL